MQMCILPQGELNMADLCEVRVLLKLVRCAWAPGSEVQCLGPVYCFWKGVKGKEGGDDNEEVEMAISSVGLSLVCMGTGCALSAPPACVSGICVCTPCVCMGAGCALSAPPACVSGTCVCTPRVCMGTGCALSVPSAAVEPPFVYGHFCCHFFCRCALSL